MRRLLPFTATALLTALASCSPSPLPVETFIGDSITGSASAPPCARPGRSSINESSMR